MTFEHPFICPHCNKENDVFVEAESFSDYAFDPRCGTCNKNMDTNGEFGLEICDELSENLISNAENYGDDR